MAWKKVHVEDADTVHGKITATLSDLATGINASNLTAELVVSDGTSGQENELKTRSVAFGTAAFSSTDDFATSTQGNLADSAIQPGDFLGDLVIGTGLSGGTHENILIGPDLDVTINLDINSLTSAVQGNIDVATNDLVALYDTDGNEHYKTTVSSIVAAVANGVTSITGGDGLTVGNTTGDVTINIDAAQTTITSIYNPSLVIGNASDSEKIDFSTDGTISFYVDGTSQVAYINNTGVFIDGNLTISGTTTTVDTDNLLVKDRFILLNNADTPTDADSGLVFSGSTKTTAFGYDQSADRLAYMKTGASSIMTTITPSAYVVTAHTSGTADADFQQAGNMHITGGDIYIWA